MRFAVLALVATVGCASPEGRSPLLPVEFSLFVARSELDSSGSIVGPGRDPCTWDTSGSSEGVTLGAGLTWALGPPPDSPALRELVRELRASRLDGSSSIVVPVKVEPVTLPVSVSAGTSASTRPADPPAAPPADPAGSAPAAPELSGDDALVELIVAAGGLATALATYLGRRKIPVVRDWCTSEGRAERKARKASRAKAGEA